MTASPSMARHIIFSIMCALSASSCSLLVDFEECASVADCKPNPDANVSCQDSICVTTPLVLEGATCTIPPESLAREPNAIRIGFIMPLSGDDGGYGSAILETVTLAINEFNSINGVRGRPLGLIVCDTQAKEALAVAAGQHLSTVAKVSAIIGADYSSHTLAIANDSTIKNKVLLISPASTSPLISDLVDDDLVWRTIISDVIQGDALAKMTSDLVTKAADPNKAKIVVLLPTDDPYSQGLAEILLNGLPARYKGGNKDLFSVINYPNASAGMSNIYSSTIATLSEESVKPDVVVLLGTAEAWEIIKGIETVLPTVKPIYMMTDGPKSDGAAQKFFPTPSDDLRARVLGTVPKTPDTSYAPYNAFTIRYNLKYGDLPTGSSVAQGYDAAYLLGLAIAAGGPSGPEIAAGLRKLNDPAAAKYIANVTTLSSTLNQLVQGKTINYEGASGPLDFNAKGDPSTGAVGIWCLKPDGSFEERPLALLDESGAFTPRRCTEEAPDMGMDMGADMGPLDMDLPDMPADMDAADMGD
jgi:branched-chain amino acid transport system substrate-binding protein